MNAMIISGLVADKVMRLDVVWQNGAPWMCDNRRNIPMFAVEPALIWQIVAEMEGRGYIWTIGSGEQFSARVAAIFHKPGDPHWAEPSCWSKGDDEAMTVCLAALRALGVEASDAPPA